ncbi:Metallo-hydrolase/oxidoreductase [Cystobasidium minutum MCA 4210]|uniref:Metallo-hydrolase/oxidoreductase n=1 Tax=Cystobasidium minutum MCA 4210 TaxID=1397322 RepID=UPI0034CED271|eukprot:jgi/Rhomi1/208017/estExt_Genemark1.C_1_t30012
MTGIVNGYAKSDHAITNGNASSSNSIQARLDAGAVLADIQNVCPEGTKGWMLCLGYLEGDEGYLVRGGNQSLGSTKDAPRPNKRRKLPMYCVLIEHPHEGLILWETGAGVKYPEVAGPVYSDAFPRVIYEPRHDLKTAIASTGHVYTDVKHIIIGHLHVDHAGGLDIFQGTDVPVWVHEKELKSAFFSVATGADVGVYLPDYLDLKLNWKTFNETILDFAQGITLHHLPGHTEGLIGMQLNLLQDGTFIFTGDLFHVKENYEDGIPQGWLARDHPSWFNSYNKIKRLQHRTKGMVIMGHDDSTCNKVWEWKKGAPLE